MKIQKNNRLFNKLEKPIIFIGTGRSGTSVITEIILRHKDLAFPSHYNELFYKYPIISLIRNIFDNRFWRIHGEKNQLNKVKFFNKFIFRRTEAYNMWEYLSGPDVDFSRDYLLNQKASNDRIEFIHTYFQKMLKYQKRKRLAFKLTGAPRIGYLLSIFPDARFVIFKRDIIPTISSFLKVDFWKEKGYNQIWINGAYSDEEIEFADTLKDQPVLINALQIRKMYEVMNVECEAYKPEHIFVSYEKFVTEPGNTIKNILSFLELSEDKDCFDYLKNKTIINRNKQKEEYFNKNEIKNIEKILDYDFKIKH